MTVVDTHAHIISSDPLRYPYAPASGSLPDWLPERSVDADQLLANMARAGVDKAVLVQYSSAHGNDNRYVLDTAARHSERFVAVVTLDGRLADAPDQLTQCVHERGAAGVRLRAPSREASLEWLTCEHLWRRAAELGTPVCVHFMQHDQAAGLPVLSELLSKFPDVQVILDHVGNPPWQAGPPEYGLGSLVRLAQHTQLFVKFATINLERLAAASVPPQPVLRRLTDVFGASRVMWGSDAPNTGGDYVEMLVRMRAALGEVSRAEQDWILGGTAGVVYPQLTSRRNADAGMSIAER